MARRLIRSRSRRRTKSFRSSDTGLFLGRSTNRRPHPRQRKLGEPAWVRPLRTTWVARHRGHGGIGSDASCIRSDYRRPSEEATTQVRLPPSPHVTPDAEYFCHCVHFEQGPEVFEAVEVPLVLAGGFPQPRGKVPPPPRTKVA